ncbi:MAG: HepT-like ribonuclease domain-containing protein [Chitinophagales bacterium]
MQANNKRDLLYLLRMLNHIELCNYFTKNVSSENDLIHNFYEKFHLATSQLIQIAENVNKISENLKITHSEIEWNKIKGFRNIIVHDYINIESDIVFEIITKELPILKNQILEIIKIGLITNVYDIGEINAAKEGDKYILIDFNKILDK